MHKFRFTNKQLKYLTKEEYLLLLKSGMFWDIYPNATGIYEEDTNEENLLDITHLFTPEEIKILQKAKEDYNKRKLMEYKYPYDQVRHDSDQYNYERAMSELNNYPPKRPIKKFTIKLKETIINETITFHDKESKVSVDGMNYDKVYERVIVYLGFIKIRHAYTRNSSSTDANDSKVGFK